MQGKMFGYVVGSSRLHYFWLTHRRLNLTFKCTEIAGGFENEDLTAKEFLFFLQNQNFNHLSIILIFSVTSSFNKILRTYIYIIEIPSRNLKYKRAIKLGLILYCGVP